jgi:hypothetical protein
MSEPTEKTNDELRGLTDQEIIDAWVRGDEVEDEATAEAYQARIVDLARKGASLPQALIALPFEIEKWLITIKAHCTVIADPSPADDVRELTACIKNNVDFDLRPAIIALLDERDRLREALNESIDEMEEVCEHAKTIRDEYAKYRIDNPRSNPNAI